MEEVEKIPSFTDPAWHDYVMSKFMEDELEKGYPKLIGLRRVTEQLIGPIEYSNVDVVQQPGAENNGGVGVKYSLTIKHSNVKRKNSDDCIPMVFSDVGEASNMNVTGEYRQHLYGVAVSRAEARVLRKLLRLKVISSDEVESGEPEERINENQVNSINVICSRENINVGNMLAPFLTTFKHKDYRKLLHREATAILKELNDNKVKYAKEFSGYESNWQ